MKDKDPAFIIGNGPSRAVINVEELKQHGTVWGCNALYRDFAPHYLVAVDEHMQEEIIGAGYHKDNPCYFRINIRKPNKLPEHKNIITWSQKLSSPNNSGVGAFYHALKKGHRVIYLVGFDLGNPPKGQRPNIYADTLNYKNQTHRPPKVRREIPEKIAEWAYRNKDKLEIIRVVGPNSNIPEPVGTLKGFEFIKHISYEEFAEEFNLTWAK